MHLTLIENGELYAPEPLGVQSILLVGDKIARIGPIAASAVKALGLEYEIIDARDCVVTPGFVDPHEHLIGAGGEQGFASRQPEVSFAELVSTGVTTVVGCLGTDTVARSLSTLLAKTRQLEANGISAYMYTGGFRVPPPTIMATIMDDLIVVDKVIGIGEIAISDYRASEPSVQDLAKLVSDGIVGGLISGKAGVTHFHTGSGKQRLKPLRQLLNDFEIPPQYVYPTHISRSRELMDEAIELTQRGAYVDIDVIDEDLAQWLQYYKDRGGPLSQLTVSSDAHTPGGSTAKLYQQFVSCLTDFAMPLEEVLPCFTRNAASVLKLSAKGALKEDNDADVLILHKDTFALRHVFAGGKHLLCDGLLTLEPKGEQAVLLP